MIISLFLIINSFHSRRDGSEDFVGYSSRRLGHLIEQPRIAKDNHFIAFGALKSGHIYQAHIHADATNNWSLLPVDKHLSVAIAEPSAQAVGINQIDYIVITYTSKQSTKFS